MEDFFVLSVVMGGIRVAGVGISLLLHYLILDAFAVRSVSEDWQMGPDGFDQNGMLFWLRDRERRLDDVISERILQKVSKALALQQFVYHPGTSLNIDDRQALFNNV